MFDKIISSVANEFASSKADTYNRRGINSAAAAMSESIRKARGIAQTAGEDTRNQFREGEERAGAYYTPYIGMGLDDLDNYRQMISSYSTNPEAYQYDTTVDIESDPSYAFRRDQAVDAVARTMRAGGYDQSGRMGMAIADYASNLASTEYASAFDRKMQENILGFDAFRHRQNLQSQQQQYQLGAQGSLAGYTSQLGYNAANARAGLAFDTSNNIANSIYNQGQLESGYEMGLGDIEAARVIGENASRANRYIQHAQSVNAFFGRSGIFGNTPGGGGSSGYVPAMSSIGGSSAGNDFMSIGSFSSFR